MLHYEDYHFKLFVADHEPNSLLAQSNLQQLCVDYLSERVTIDVIDIVENFKLAMEYEVWLTPTLIVIHPPPKIVVVGTLNDTKKVLNALRIKGPYSDES